MTLIDREGRIKADTRYHCNIAELLVILTWKIGKITISTKNITQFLQRAVALLMSSQLSKFPVTRDCRTRLNSFSEKFRSAAADVDKLTKANSAFHPSGVGKWVPVSAGKAKAGIVRSVSGWTRGVQVKLWDPLRTRAIPERLRGVFTTRCYTNPCLPYLTLLYLTFWKMWTAPTAALGTNWHAVVW